jgi:hypothetical protein
MTPGFDWTLAHALDACRDAVLEAMRNNGTSFADYSLARLFPFFEGMGSWPGGTRKEFWWEREWRHVGDFSLPASGVIWLCPEDEIDAVRTASGRPLTPWIDPRWGLETIIAHLAGFEPADISPFAPLPDEPAEVIPF